VLRRFFLALGHPAPPVCPQYRVLPCFLPFIDLAKLVRYRLCHIAALTHGGLGTRITGATGDSRGIDSTVANATTATFEEFVQHSFNSLRWLFDSDLRGQKMVPITPVEPGAIQDAIEGGEGTRSQPLKELEPHVTKTTSIFPQRPSSSYLPDGTKEFVARPPKGTLWSRTTSLRMSRRPLVPTRAIWRPPSESSSSPSGF